MIYAHEIKYARHRYGKGLGTKNNKTKLHDANVTEMYQLSQWGNVLDVMNCPMVQDLPLNHQGHTTGYVNHALINCQDNALNISEQVKK